MAKYVFEGEMKDDPISKLLITKTGHRPTQHKKIIDTLQILCTDKNYQRLDGVIWNRIDQVEADFMRTYPDATKWSNTHRVEIETVDPSVSPDANTGVRPGIVTLLKQIHVFNPNI